MKKFSAVMALVIAIFIGGRASAASWEVIESNDNGIVTSVDKDSIKRGTDSKNFPKFNRQDGFSAIVKLDVKVSDSKNIEMIYLVSFYENNGERMYCLLDGYGETSYPSKESEVLQENVDTDGAVWKKVWSYIEKNLK